MDGARHGAELEQLLAEIGWVQRLARGLVRDPAGAEDLAQEALVRSLDARAHAPSSPGALRAWLATIVRRIAIDRGRTETSRAARETSRVNGRTDAHDEPFAIVARSERQQELVRAVHALTEPYRTTILLRYLDELGPRYKTALILNPVMSASQLLRTAIAWLQERRLTPLLDATPAGHARMRAELDQLWRVERPQVTQAVSEAAAQGDRSENAEYIYGKKRLREIDKKIEFLTKRLEILKVVFPDETRSDGRIFFGAYVELEDDDGETLRVRIVGPDEADPEAGSISMDSPVGKALLGKSLGDEVRVSRPRGITTYSVVEVSYRPLP
mgnify:CR=1 FL=1